MRARLTRFIAWVKHVYSLVSNTANQRAETQRVEQELRSRIEELERKLDAKMASANEGISRAHHRLDTLLPVIRMKREQSEPQGYDHRPGNIARK